MTGEMTFDDPLADDFTALSRDRIPVRSLRASDLDDIVRIDARIFGHERRQFLTGKMDEVLHRSGVRMSLIAPMDRRVAGFVMARVDHGAFGAVEPVAVLDTLGVDPAYARQGIGRALMSQLLINLKALQIPTLRTEVPWGRFDLEHFLSDCGFVPSQRICLAKAIQ